MDQELFDQALQLIQVGIAKPEDLDGFFALVDTLRRESHKGRIIPDTIYTQRTYFPTEALVADFPNEPAVPPAPPVPDHLTDGYVTYESTLNGLSFDSDNWEASYDETPGGETFIFTRKRANKIPTADEVFGIFGD